MSIPIDMMNVKRCASILWMTLTPPALLALVFGLGEQILSDATLHLERHSSDGRASSKPLINCLATSVLTLAMV
jgi:hypothetical protein